MNERKTVGDESGAEDAERRRRVGEDAELTRAHHHHRFFNTHAYKDRYKKADRRASLGRNQSTMSVGNVNILRT